MTSADDITHALLSMSDDGQARQMQRFFKTGPGQYAEGDRFIGVRNPQVRAVVKQTWKTTRLDTASRLVASPLHEVRLCGLLIMVEQYQRAMKANDHATMSAIFDTYLTLHPHINNWDLVDLSAIKIIGNHELLNPGLTLMDQWINPRGHTMWQQRIAMVSTWILIRNHRADTCFRRAAILADSPHDLLHKAAGWMLRECWKAGYRDQLRAFLEQHVTHMPAIMLSYTCEQMPADERHHWQQQRRLATPIPL